MAHMDCTKSQMIYYRILINLQMIHNKLLINYQKQSMNVYPELKNFLINPFDTSVLVCPSKVKISKKNFFLRFL